MPRKFEVVIREPDGSWQSKPYRSWASAKRAAKRIAEHGPELSVCVVEWKQNPWSKTSWSGVRSEPVTA